MTVWKQWFNTLSEKQRDTIIERAYLVKHKEVPIGYSETYDYSYRFHSKS